MSDELLWADGEVDEQVVVQPNVRDGSSAVDIQDQRWGSA